MRVNKCDLSYKQGHYPKCLSTLYNPPHRKALMRYALLPPAAPTTDLVILEDTTPDTESCAPPDMTRRLA